MIISDHLMCPFSITIGVSPDMEQLVALFYDALILQSGYLETLPAEEENPNFLVGTN